MNLAHFDLQRPNGQPYPTDGIRRVLNTYLAGHEASVLVRQVIEVPPTFSSRFAATSRHYLYRIGVTNSSDTPVAEWKRCHFIPEPFCVDTAREACRLLTGTNEYASFCHKLANLAADFPTVRTIDQFEIRQGRPLMSPDYDPYYDGIRFYDFHVRARSFMYKVRLRSVFKFVLIDSLCH